MLSGTSIRATAGGGITVRRTGDTGITYGFGEDAVGMDVKLFGDTSGRYALWDASADKLTIASGATLDIAGTFKIGGVTVTATAAQINAAAASITTDLDLGLSGTAGSLDIFPATAANGKLILTATDMGGAWNLAITNDAIAAARAYKIPDAGGDGKFVMTTAANSLLVNCNAANRTMNLSGNVTLAGAFSTAAAVTFAGANALTVNVPAGGSNITLPASGTLLTDAGDLTATTSSTWTVDSDSANAKIKLDTNAATGNFTLSIVPANLSANVTVTVPAATDTLVNLAGTQTLAAKTLTAPVVNGMTTAAAANNFVLNTGSGTFTTPTGTFTHYGNVANNGNITFDFSGSNGTFKTSTGANTLGGDVTIAAGKQLDIGTAAGGDATPLRIFSATAANGILVLKCQDDANNNTTTLQSGDPGAAANPTITLPIATSTLATIGLAETLDLKTLTNAGAIAQTGAVAFTTGTGAVSLNGAVTISGVNTFATGSGAATLNGSATFATTKTLTFGSAAAGTATPITMFSLTANKGGFILACQDNATDHAVTLRNGAANGAAATVTTPNATCTLSGLGLAETFSGVKTFSVAPAITILDANDAVVTDMLTFTHNSAGATSAGYGVGVAFAMKDAGGVEEQASLDAVMATVTDGAEDCDLVFKVQLNGDVSQALKIDSVNHCVTIGQNASDVDGMDTLRIYGLTAAKGSLVIQSVANTDDVAVTLKNAAHATAGRTYTFGDAGADKYVAYTAQANGSIARSDLTEDSLARYQIPLMQMRTASGLVMDATGGAGLFAITNGGYGVGTLVLTGEGANNNTKTDTFCFEFCLPPEYIADQDVKVVVQAKYAGAGTVGTKTIDCEVYELADDGTTAGDIQATAIQTLTTSYADYTFVLTDTLLTAGDRILVFVRTVIQETATGGALTVTIGSVEVQCDIKG